MSSLTIELEIERAVRDLVVAFGKPWTSGDGTEFATMCRRKLSDLEPQELRIAVDDCIRNERKFPLVATIRKYALDTRARLASARRWHETKEADEPPFCIACLTRQLYVAPNGRMRPLHADLCRIVHPADMEDQRAAIANSCEIITQGTTPVRLAPASPAHTNTAA